MSVVFNLTEKSIVLAEIQESFKDFSHGAQLFFLGVVRNNNNGKKVRAVSYDVHRELASKVFQEICQEVYNSNVSKKPESNINILLIHRVGTLQVGECSVLIAVGAPHRDEVYRISRHIIEELKTRAPIWKKEHYEDGESEWLKGHELCGTL
ncbi:MAG: molybdenum cofactor biosynthesis protein MoaE [Bdellovibrio sp.]|nr:molybdenum cofactor biosynthesis protein MoaE [Bdellovibrio sp.]